MDIQSICSLLDQIKNDRSVPKNIRSSVEIAMTSLTDDKKEMPVRINSAISILDEISNDPNIPMYTRTQIWNVVSMLESFNEQAKP